MPYMLDPGARLMVGPHGQLEESLGGATGACCAPCAASGSRCGTALGATKTKALASRFGAVVGATKGPPPARRRPILLFAAVAGVAGLGLILLRRRGRRRR
jgi:hypothetical protein